MTTFSRIIQQRLKGKTVINTGKKKANLTTVFLLHIRAFH